MNANKELWAKGDFTRIAESMRESGEALVRELGVTEGLKVPDPGCGDGTTAVPAVRRGHAEFKSYYGPTMNAFAAAATDGREADLQAELEELFNEQNTSEDGATSIPATFLQVTVRR